MVVDTDALLKISDAQHEKKCSACAILGAIQRQDLDGVCIRGTWFVFNNHKYLNYQPMKKGGKK